MNSPRRRTTRGVGQREGAGDDQRGVFAEAVPRGESRREPALGAGGGGRDARGQHGRLRGGGEREVGLGPLEDHATEIDAERVVGLVEHAPGGGGGVVKRAPHADRLRALAGERERDHAVNAPILLERVPLTRL
jgi:hypothetical protein